MGYLIDTCIWIDVERGLISPSDVALYTESDSVYISPVTLASLSVKINYWARLIEALRIKPAGYTDDPILLLEEYSSFIR